MKYLYLLTAIVLFTQLRGGVLIAMPLLLIFFNKIQPFYPAGKKFVVLFSLFFISALTGILMGWTTYSGVLLSAWLFLPILRCFYATPRPVYKNVTLYSFIKSTYPVLLVIDLIGLLVWLKVKGDEFGIAYGRHYEYVHGLAVVNLMYFFYYVSQIVYKNKSRKNIFLAILFFLSFTFCDFGLGWVTFFLTILAYLLLHINIKNILLLTAVIGLGGIFLQSDRFSYERQNINNVKLNQEDARKVLMFYETGNLYKENLLIPILGTGPGGYNSRSAVLLSGDSDNIFTKILGHQYPVFYQKYIYILWNKDFVSQDSYTDGTRNKPYSSFVAIFCEHGLIFGVIFFFCFFYRIYKFYQLEKKNSIYFYLVFLNIFMLISCIIHEWIVSTEFVLFLIINYIAICDLNRINKKGI